MRSISLQLEITTPLLLSGANQSEAELRVPSIRGPLRFWFRAMMGGLVGDNLEKLWELESKVFGSVERSSSLRLMLKEPENLGKEKFRKEDYRGKLGISYLGFPFYLKGLTREFIKPDQSFLLELSARENRLEAPKVALSSLWLLLNLGGLGSRSRRGFGSISFKEGDLKEFEKDLPKFKLEARNLKGLRDYLQNGISITNNLFRKFAQTNRETVLERFSASPNYPVISSNHCKVLVLQETWNYWEEAIDSMGRKLQDFRKESPLLRRAAFGLPLDKFSWRSRPEKEENRRASPLFFHFSRLANNELAAVITFFKAQFLPGGVRFQQGERKVEVPDLSLIKEFLNTFKAREVNLP